MSEREDEFLVGLAANLARLIRSRHRSTVEVAELAGLPEARVEGFLAAEIEPGALEILRLAKALEVEPGQLLDGLAWDRGEGRGRG